MTRTSSTLSVPRRPLSIFSRQSLFPCASMRSRQGCSSSPTKSRGRCSFFHERFFRLRWFREAAAKAVGTARLTARVLPDARKISDTRGQEVIIHARNRHSPCVQYLLEGHPFFVCFFLTLSKLR